MAMHVIMQREEINPHNPHQSRWSRPVQMQVAEPPEITSTTWWSYGDAGGQRAAAEAAEWDERWPCG